MGMLGHHGYTMEFYLQQLWCVVVEKVVYQLNELMYQLYMSKLESVLVFLKGVVWLSQVIKGHTK